MFNPPEITSPAAELAESREVAAAGEVAGPILAKHLEFPEGLAPEWSPLIAEMRAELGEATEAIVRQLIAEGRPEPLVAFAQDTAAANVATKATFPPVPLATIWEITNLYALHQEGGDENVVATVVPGGQIDGQVIPTAVGGSFDWSGPLYLREGQSLVVSVASGGLTAGNRLEAAIFGRIHSTR